MVQVKGSVVDPMMCRVASVEIKTVFQNMKLRIKNIWNMANKPEVTQRISELKSGYKNPNKQVPQNLVKHGISEKIK